MTIRSIVLTKSWLDAMDALDPRQQRAVWSTLRQATRDVALVRPNALEGSDFTEWRVDSKAWRIIGFSRSASFVACYVGAHDPALAWARRSRVEDQPDGLVVRVQETEDRLVVPPGPLAAFRDTLLGLALAPPVAELLLRATDAEARAVAGLLPGATRDALIDLLNGVPRADGDPSSDEHPTASREITDAAFNEHLAMAEAPVTLAQQQKLAVLVRCKGAYRVSGGPGTGKTLVAVFRARYLALRLFPDTRDRILLVSPVDGARGLLRREIKKLCSDRSDLHERIDVSSLTDVAVELLKVKAAGAPPTLASAVELDQAWAIAMAEDPEGRWSRAQYEAERAQVLDVNDAWTFDAYEAADRSGRGASRPARDRTWRVLDRYERALSERGSMDRYSLARRARSVLDERRGLRPWRAVVCDEAQDLCAGEIRLLAALTRDGARSHCLPNALYLVGDGRQRVLARPPKSMKDCDIHVVGRGRAQVLRECYRATQGIVEASLVEVKELSPDPFDAWDNPATGYRSHEAGDPPTRRTYATFAEEVDAVVESYLNGKGGMFVLARTLEYLMQVAQALAAHPGAPEHTFLDPEEGPAEGAITLSTFDDCRSLETTRVVIVGAHLVPQPYAGPDDDGERRWHDHNEKRRLYTAMQRAQKELSIFRVRADGPAGPGQAPGANAPV